MQIKIKEISIIFILVIIAFVRFFFFLPEKQNYDKFVGEEVSMTGIVVDNPDHRIYNDRLIVRPDKDESNVLVVVPKNSEVVYGDRVKIKGILETPENFITSVGKEFNYKRYLANKDIYFIIEKAEIEILSSGNGGWLKSGLFKIRNKFMKNIDNVVVAPESDLANGLILGERGGFDSEMKDEFIKTGTIHIVALSGYNITIISENVMKLFGLIASKIISTISAVFIVLLFILMTGASATSIRAGIMAIIILFANITGRTYDAGRALVVAGLLMITYDLRVITDISFQLSFIATFGILFITKKVNPWFRFVPKHFKLRETISTTFSATIAVLPVLLYSTGVFSLVSLPANILILPFIPIAMLFSFLTGVTGFISPVISTLFAFISDMILSYILGVIHFFGNLSFASFGIKSFPLVVTVAIYILILWWVFKKTKIPQDY